jgi:hypothetical protein
MHFETVLSAFALIAAAFLCAACGSSGQHGADPGKYAGEVCSAITALERDVAAATNPGKNPTATNATQAKQVEQRELAAVAEASDRALTRIRAAGTPAIRDGQAVADTVVKTFAQVRDAMRRAAAEAKSLPTSSPQAYTTAAERLAARVQTSLASIDASGLANPDLEQAAARQPACQQLSG